jgi:hypothetical protein
MRQRLYVGVMPLPAMPVAAADSGGADGDDDAVVGRRWIGDAIYAQRATEIIE